MYEHVVCNCVYIYVQTCAYVLVKTLFIGLCVCALHVHVHVHVAPVACIFYGMFVCMCVHTSVLSLIRISLIRISLIRISEKITFKV